MDWKFEKNMYPILDTRVKCKCVQQDKSKNIKNSFNRIKVKYK